MGRKRSPWQLSGDFSTSKKSSRKLKQPNNKLSEVPAEKLMAKIGYTRKGIQVYYKINQEEDEKKVWEHMKEIIYQIQV